MEKSNTRSKNENKQQTNYKLNRGIEFGPQRSRETSALTTAPFPLCKKDLKVTNSKS